MRTRWSSWLVWTWLGFSASALAGPTLELDARVQSTLLNDELSVVLAAERDAPQVGPANQAVLGQLNAALAQARAVDGVRARLGAMQTLPNFDPSGAIQSWRVRGVIVLESSRLGALSELTGQLASTLQIDQVSFRLSDARRFAEEQKLLKSVAQAFRERAAQAANALGYAGYELRSMTLRPQTAVMPTVRMAAMPMAESRANLPTDAGESDIEVSMSGTIELR
jgi:predicted secreted protein